MDRKKDQYDLFFDRFALWLPRLDPLIGFPVKALHPSVLRKEYLIALSLIGLRGESFKTHCLYYRRYLRSLGVRPPEDYDKEPGFLNEEYVHFMLRDRKIHYYPDYPDFRIQYGTLEELGLDVPTVLNYWRENQAKYTISDVEFHPDGRVKYFKFVGSDEPYYVEVPVTKVTLNPTSEEVEHVPEYSLQLNFAAALMEQMFAGQEVDFLTVLMSTLTTFTALGVVQSAKLIGEGLKALWERFKSNGQPVLMRADFVDKGLLTADEFDIVVEAIEEREKLLNLQESYLRNLLVNADTADTNIQLNSLNDSNPYIEELLTMLTAIERTYVRL